MGLPVWFWCVIWILFGKVCSEPALLYCYCTAVLFAFPTFGGLRHMLGAGVCDSSACLTLGPWPLDGSNLTP